MSTDPGLIQMTIRVERAVKDALDHKAERIGQEPADYAADILTRHLLGDIGMEDHATADRLQAELDLKEVVIGRARELSPTNAFNEDVTLKVFQWIKAHPDLEKLYIRAIGGGSADARGNHAKARLNRTLGATIKRAVGADSKLAADGKPEKAQVYRELIFSYTPLKPRSAPEAARRRR